MSYINDKFLSTILSIDFLLLNCSIRKKSFIVLNVFEVNKSLQQLIEILSFVRENSGEVFILVKDRFSYFLVKKYIEIYLSAYNINIVNNFSKVNVKSPNEVNNMLINLDDSNLSKKGLNVNFYLEKKISFVYQVSSKLFRLNNGIYTLQNDIRDYKKLIFILVLITKVLKKKNA